MIPLLSLAVLLIMSGYASESKKIPLCMHTVKSYMGDSYWRSVISYSTKNKEEYVKRFGIEEYTKLIKGEETNSQKREGYDCD